RQGMKYSRWIGIALAGLVLLTGLWGSVGQVAAGDTGVVTSFGAVKKGDLKPEGLYFVVPFVEKVHVMDTKPHKLEIDDDSAVTSDRQEVKISLALLVQVDPATADRTYDQYRDDLVDQVVMPKVLEAVKTITARYDAATQVRQRGLVQAEMLSYIQHETLGKGVIIPPGALSVTNFAYNQDYQDAIEQTAVSQQNLVKAEADLRVNKIEAEQKVATARGEAESQALLSRTLTPASLQFEFYKHWDGKRPLVMGGGGNILDVSKLVGDAR
ncbi:MAG TPA: prohibitin family protein, partial [Candidatus Baltobacteraceae bacterium]